MMRKREYMQLGDMLLDQIDTAITGERNNKPVISMVYGRNGKDLAFVTPVCTTFWPRCTGDGNMGTTWGPTDPLKAKFTLDLTDCHSNEEVIKGFHRLKATLDFLDNNLLELVYNNQHKCLNRRNLTKDECKMLQNPCVRPKYDKVTGALTGFAVQLSAPKYVSDGQGGYRERKINICDYAGNVIPNGKVCPGDIVRATLYISNIYTGIGDKFGISLGFEDVSIVCQNTVIEQQKTHVPEFEGSSYECARPYVEAVIPIPTLQTKQFESEAKFLTF